MPAEVVDMLRERKKKSTPPLIFPTADGKPNGHLLRILKYAAYRADLNCGECIAKQDGTHKRSCKHNPVCRQHYLHRFRKTWATRMHHAGVPLRDLQKMLGHKSLSTTEKYLAETDPKAAHIQAAADRAFSF